MRNFTRGVFALLIITAMAFMGACDFILNDEGISAPLSSSVEESSPLESELTSPTDESASVKQESATPEAPSSADEPLGSFVTSEESVENSADTSETPSLETSEDTLPETSEQPPEASEEESSEKTSVGGEFELPEDKFD